MLFHREPYGEPGAFPRLGGYGDPASHALYNGFADRQPQSGTLLERVNFIKSVEYLLCHVRRDAAPGIRDEKPNFLSVAGKRITEVYMAFFCESVSIRMSWGGTNRLNLTPAGILSAYFP